MTIIPFYLFNVFQIRVIYDLSFFPILVFIIVVIFILFFSVFFSLLFFTLQFVQPAVEDEKKWWT